jgi:hypothetical protein
MIWQLSKRYFSGASHRYRGCLFYYRSMSSSYWSSPFNTSSSIIRASSGNDTSTSSSSSPSTNSNSTTLPSTSSSTGETYLLSSSSQYPFDTNVFIDRLEKEGGYSRKQSESIMSLLSEVIRERYVSRRTRFS